MASPLAAGAGTTIVTTTSYDYDIATGLLKKKMVEPGDPDLCLVTEYTLDAFGHPKVTTTRNCKGSLPLTPGAATEAPPPTGDAVIAPREVVNTYGEDQRFVETVTNPAKHRSVLSHDRRFGGIATLEDANGLVASFRNDDLGRRTLETSTDGTQVKTEYVYCAPPNPPPTTGWPAAPTGAAAASCAAVVYPSGVSLLPLYYIQRTPLQVDGATPNGPYTRLYFDSFGRELRTETVTDANGAEQRIQEETKYDVIGNVVGRSAPHFADAVAYWVDTQYDALDRRTHVVEAQAAGGPATTVTRYSGQTVQVTDPRGNVTTYAANVAGQVVRITDAKGGTLSREYDPLGNLVQTTDAKGNVTSVLYDRRGRKRALYDPDMGVWTYEPDAVGNVVRQTDAKGQTLRAGYDTLNRMTSRSETDLATTWWFDYNRDGTSCGKGVGQLCKVFTDHGYSRRQTFDARGRPSTASTDISGTYSVGVEYDPASGRVVSQTYPSGLQTRILYTPLGIARQVLDARNGAALWTARARNAAGQLLLQEQGNGVVTDSTYYPDGRLRTTEAVGIQAVQSLSYAYDENRNLSVRMDLATGITAKYGYDELNRLRSEARSGGALPGTQTLGWDYDPIGNLISRTDEGGVTSVYHYNTSGRGSRRPHAVAGVSGFVNARALPTYAYDDNGNMSSGAGRTLTWTSSDRVQTLTSGGRQLTYYYGPDHERVKETYAINGAVQRTTVYLNPAGGAGLFYEEQTGTAGTRRTHYISAGGATVAAIVCTALPCTSPNNSSTVYWHEDQLGSVNAVTDATRAVIERMAYEPFGKRRHANGLADDLATLAPATTDRGFTEQEHIDEMALVNLNGRVYDPSLGRFISADPGVPYPDSTQSYNRYSYTRNNPLRAVDPSGFDDYDVYSGGSGAYGDGSFDSDNWSRWDGSFSVMSSDLSNFGTGAPNDSMAGMMSQYGRSDGPITGTTPAATMLPPYAVPYLETVTVPGYSGNSESPAFPRVEIPTGPMSGVAPPVTWAPRGGLMEALEWFDRNVVTPFGPVGIGAKFALAAGPLLVKFTAAAKAAAPFSHLVPGGGLAAHEAAGGHLIARHVGQSEAALAARLAGQPRLGAASTFASRAEAEAAISGALNARAADVNAWVAAGARGRLVIDGAFSGGSVLQRGAAAAVPGTGVRAVLEGTGGGGWRIITGYPTP